MKRKISVIASSRATYGYKRKIIGLIQKSHKLELQLIVTGMHLLKEYGLSIREIEADGFPITAKVEMMIMGDTPTAWAKSIGVEIESLAQVLSMTAPDLVLVTGDRAEMFAAAITASYMNIPVAHIQAGDVSGHIDGSVRHAITKLSHIHFASCDDSALRVKKMGEEPWRIFNVGAPQLDSIIHDEKLSKQELNQALDIDLGQPTILVIQHPVLSEIRHAKRQMKETMAAVSQIKAQTLIIYPNMDSGGIGIIEAIRAYEKFPFIHTYKNIERNVFISLLKEVSVLVGNSSCGIIEAPSFKLAAVNIGSRQHGRLQAQNVMNVPYNRREIKKAIQQALFDADFKEKLKKCVNPYGDGKSSERIVKLLEQIKIDKRLLDKKMEY
jgi:UDP-N-acetylglucosamine 2-epimerase (non-hydrolysing)/GDP/UDP-N,N'-diacetylbacillosamine 2-epimerase (hydrolysing)